MFESDACSYTCGYNPDFLDRVYTQRRAMKRLKQAELSRERNRDSDKERQRDIWQSRPREFNAHVATYLKHKLLVEEGMDVKKRRMVGDIILEIAREHGVSVDEIIGASRNARLVRIRHKAMWAARKERPDLSLPQLGRLFGGRDHTTIIHGIRRHKERMEAALA